MEFGLFARCIPPYGCMALYFYVSSPTIVFLLVEAWEGSTTQPLPLIPAVIFGVTVTFSTSRSFLVALHVLFGKQRGQQQESHGVEVGDPNWLFFTPGTIQSMHAACKMLPETASVMVMTPR